MDYPSKAKKERSKNTNKRDPSYIVVGKNKGYISKMVNIF